MTSDPASLTPDRDALIEHAARQAADHPTLSALTLIAEHGLCVAEAHAALRRAEQMRICRRAFA